MILGIDEVGRGPWAGPLVIGAVILKDPTAAWCEKLTDSKKLTAHKREQLAAEILDKAAATALGWVSARELDQIGLAKALRLATRRAVKTILLQKVTFNEIIIDGTANFLEDTPLADKVTILKKADLLVKEVSAASIIAKVARDEYMADLAEVYPEYGFESHVGYGTKKHRESLAKFGPTPEHRTSFKPVAQPKKNTTAVGNRAEGIVAQYLTDNGHRIIKRNHKTKFYEIDIISTKEDKIYFTEVKYRTNSRNGTPLATITAKKQQQMRYAAEAFLKYQPYFKQNFQPQLAAASVSGSGFHLDTWLPLG